MKKTANLIQPFVFYLSKNVPKLLISYPISHFLLNISRGRIYRKLLKCQGNTSNFIIIIKSFVRSWEKMINAGVSGLKSDCLAEIKALPRIKSNISLYKSLSKILQQIGSKDSGRKFFKVYLSPFWWISTILAFSTCMDIYYCLCSYWKWASKVWKSKYSIIPLSCEYSSYNNDLPYSDVVLQLF